MSLPDLLRVFSSKSARTSSFLPSKPTAQLIILTSAPETSATWLLDNVFRARFAGAGAGCATEKKVVLVSFLHDFSFHIESMRKYGVDLAARSRTDEFAFVDGFSRLLDDPAEAPDGDNVVLSAPATGWKAQISAAMGAAGSSLLVVEAPEMAVGLGMLSDADMHYLLMDLQAQSVCTVVVTTPLGEHLDGGPRLQSVLADRALAVLSVRPLSTGMARDVTGTVTIERGGAPLFFFGDGRDTDEDTVEAGEFLFSLGEGAATSGSSLRVFEKGTV
ncbi:uncharacterized protein V1510DRAFT_414450 [Dipodascopsis tothii]|uniref:uncharacterized protein n=1 Tax=Dipodascopsis tothii TaxID=44089 RepID=UPI0034CEF001